MNWPPPTLLPPPRVGDQAPIEVAPDTRPSRSLPAATWLSLLGAGLLLTAAVAVVASNWAAIGQGLRVGGRVATTVALLVLSERLRSSVPTTSGVVAHVGTGFVGFAGIAAMSLAGFTWPTCILVGGAALAVAAGIQADRWRRGTMHAFQVVGLALAATGLATVWSAPTAVVTVVLAVTMMAVGAERRSVALSILAVSSPVLVAVADAGIGPGVLIRAGLVGDPLGWSGPAVGVLAALVIGVAARRRRHRTLVLVAAASPVLGLVTGFAASDAPAVAWWTLPALALLAGELACRLARQDDGPMGPLLDLFASVVAGFLWTSPALVSVGAWASGDGRTWAVPTAFTAFAVAASTLRWHDRGSRLVDLGAVAIAASLVAGAITFELGDVAIAVTAVLVSIAATVSSRRLAPIAVHGSAVWALVAIGALGRDGDGSPYVAAALLATTAVVVIGARARLAADNGPVGWIEMTAVVWSGAVTATALTSLPDATTMLTSAAALLAFVVLVERRFAWWSAAIGAVTGVLALDAASAAGPLDPTIVVGWAALTVAFAAQWAVNRATVAAHAAVAAAVVTVATSGAWFGVEPLDAAWAAMLAAVGFTGLAVVTRQPLVASAAGAAGAVVIASVGFPIDPAWSSLAWIVVGLQLALGGHLWGRGAVSVAGLAVVGGGTLDGWVSTGLHAWTVEALAPADITSADLWFAVLLAASIVGGALVRRRSDLTSWATHSPALAITALWLVPVQLDRDPVWALPLLLTIGVVAVVAGAWHRLTASLVGGTVLTATAVLLAFGDDLRAMPTWVWLALGGGVLLAVAMTIERREGPGYHRLGSFVRRWR